MDPQNSNPTAPQDTAMYAPAADVRQQIAASISAGKNVLVTVKSSPTVDELASALGLTFLLGKLDKHATAVFSGKIPSAMEFLDPENIFEDSVDSLRDFIIALDKEKADKLRYKVEDDVVKVFITPYKTIISEKDLSFSQGDFNVDVVIALGVIQREELDKAILAHGRILHDATVITINSGSNSSNLGSIDWHDETASSVAEMLVGLSETLGANNLDGQISTALLTGVVAETNRFSNDKTSPKVMSIAAQLMAAGANQQLIATNLRQDGMITQPVRDKKDTQHDDDGEMVLDHDEPDIDSSSSSDKGDKSDSVKPPEVQADELTEELSDKNNQQADTADTTSTPKNDLKKALETANSDNAEGIYEPKQSLSGTKEESKDNQPKPEKPEADIRQHKVIEPLSSQSDQLDSTYSTPPLPPINMDSPKPETDKPIFGGTLNATTAEAEEQNRLATSEADENARTLEHAGSPEAAKQSVDEARQAVEDAASSAPFNPAGQPIESINSSPLPTIEPDKTLDSNVSLVQATAASSPVEPEPSPVDAFMQPQGTPNELTDAYKINIPAAPLSQPASPVNDSINSAAMPPLPPLPSTSAGGMPPLPPMPGQPPYDPSSVVQPQINPGFVQDMPASANPWTQAGDDLAAKQADKESARQQKIDQMGQQYDRAQDRQRELQGLPPLNNPNGSGLPPLPPQK